MVTKWSSDYTPMAFAISTAGRCSTSRHLLLNLVIFALAVPGMRREGELVSALIDGHSYFGCWLKQRHQPLLLPYQIMLMKTVLRHSVPAAFIGYCFHPVRSKHPLYSACRAYAQPSAVINLLLYCAYAFFIGFLAFTRPTSFTDQRVRLFAFCVGRPIVCAIRSRFRLGQSATSRTRLLFGPAAFDLNYLEFFGYSISIAANSSGRPSWFAVPQLQLGTPGYR